MALSFDSDHETNELREGGASIGRLSWGQYGSRVGVPRIERLLARHGVSATFFVPAVSALLHPDEQMRLVAAGHEIGLHGWIHKWNTGLPPGVERDLLLRSCDTLERITGVRPVGMRTPSWDFSPDTLRIAIELGLSYDSSLMADEDCYELLLQGKPTGIVEVPIEWIRDDAAYLLMHRGSGLRPYLRLYGEARGRAAEYWGGVEAEASDRWLIANSVPERSLQWSRAQTPQFRADLDAFARGINDFAARHPEQLDPKVRAVLPIAGVDIIAHAHKLMNYNYIASEKKALGDFAADTAGGSNAWAVAPSRSASGKTMLLANPHLPWEPSQLTYYEAHLNAPGS